MKPCGDQTIWGRIAEARQIWFFLDYDGTLANFAPTPDDILPDPKLIELIGQLQSDPNIRVTIISGRRLAHIQALLPIPGLMKAGSYGLEMETIEGELLHRLDLKSVRPFLDGLKLDWEPLTAGKPGFYLEDKDWTLAIHARDAEENEARRVLERAQSQAKLRLAENGREIFRLLGGHRFLECGPVAADKKRTVTYILDNFSWIKDALLIYLGDDDKDALAFSAVQEAGGLAVAVGNRLLESSADCRLESPEATREWLRAITQIT